MLIRPLLGAAAFVLVGAISAAQAPHITPAGDPSVNPDTIYRLTVKPSEFPEETAILLLDDGVLRIEPDGRSEATYRQVVQILRPEAVASDSNGVLMSVEVSSPTTWATIGKWYANNARSRYVSTPAVDSAIAAAVKGSRTLDDSIRAVHRWVAQDINYVSIALGLGGYQPRSPDEVVRTGFGDCKDKATLFVVALKKLGVTAFPVILSSTGGVQRGMPSISQLDHAIAAYKLPGRTQYEYADLTASLTPLGQLPFAYQGGFGLVVHPDGTSEEITFPKAPLAGNQSVDEVVGVLSATGEFNGSYQESGAGAGQYTLRAAYENPFDTAQRSKIANAAAARIFEGAQGDSLDAFSGKDLQAPARVSLLVRGGHAASMAGNNAILTNPLGSMVGFATMAQQLETAGPRRFPIDAEKVFGYGVRKLEFRVTLPEGWHAQLPPSIDASSEFGRYQDQHSQIGRNLVISRTMTGAAGIYPPDQASALLQWIRSISKDDAKLIVIDKSAQ